MSSQIGTIVPQTSPVDKLIAELGPKHEQAIVTLFFASGCACSNVLQGDIAEAQEITREARTEIERKRGRIVSAKYEAVQSG